MPLRGGDNDKKNCLLVVSVGIVALLILVLVVGTRKPTQPDDYKYPITPEASEWSQLASVDAKIAACRIPQDILETMTNEQLIKAVFDYPFLIDLFVYSSFEAGVEDLEKNSDAYAELIERGDVKEDLMKEVEKRAAIKAEDMTADEEILNDALAILILYNDKLRSLLSEEDISEVQAISLMVRNAPEMG